MPGTKRKASLPSTCDGPTKTIKKNSSKTTSRKTGRINKRTSARKLPMKAIKSSDVMEITAWEPVDIHLIIPSLRRASTLTLEEDVDKRAVCAKTSLPKMSLALSKKSSSFVETGALVTRLSGLASGSIIGETSMALTPSELSTTKTGSMKSSSVCPSDGVLELTKVDSKAKSSKNSDAAPKSPLKLHVDETELTSALVTLRSSLSKEKSIETLNIDDKTSSSSKSSVAKLPFETGAIVTTTTRDTADDNVGKVTEIRAETLHLPPGGLLEVAVSFDTTGSMSGVLDEVKAKVQDLVQRLQADIPGIRISVIAHGDYCDEGSTYVVKWIDFGASLPEICEFVKNAERTGGGDGPECYELVMLRAREVLSWTPGSQRVLIMIFDDIPHEPGYTYGGKTYNIDWRVECAGLRDMSVKIYAVQAGSGTNTSVQNFSKEITRITGGISLSLKTFSNVFDMLMMICYREGNPDMLPIYELEVRSRNSGNMAADLVALTAGTIHTSKVTSVAKKVKKCGKGIKLGATKKGTTRTSKTLPLTSTFDAKTSIDVHLSKAVKTAKRKLDKESKKTKLVDSNFKVKESKMKRVHKRETVPDAFMTKGPMRVLAWSRWQIAIQPSLLGKQMKTRLEKCRIFSGYIPKMTSFDTKNSALYEFAVQCPKSRKKRVLYFWMSKCGFIIKRALSSYLLRHKTVRSEVERLLKQNCSIYVRRGVAYGSRKKRQEKMQNVHNYVRDNLDYAWKKYIWRKVGGKQTHRLVQVSNKGSKLTLSDDHV